MIIKIKVRPGSKSQEIIKEKSNYVIKLKSLPKNNKANIELIKLLSKHFNASQKNIKIKNGLTSKDKTIEIIQ